MLANVNGDGYADLIIGASGRRVATGRVYLYAGSASGLALAPTTTLTNPEGSGGFFGASVAAHTPTTTLVPRAGCAVTRPSRTVRPKRRPLAG